MKSVLISINPKWCELITSGKKTVEVRKTKPKLDVPFKCYIYETKGKLRWCNKCQDPDCERPYPNCACHEGWGKVIGEFVCDDIDTVHIFNELLYCVKNSQANKLGQMCLTLEEVKAYLGDKNGYNWHITDLVIYDKPRELSEFYNPEKVLKSQCMTCVFNDGHGRFNGCKGDNCWENTRLKRPPQSWCYVEEDYGNK